MKAQSPRRRVYTLLLGVILLVGASGCVATRGWVHQQMAPLSQQVSEVEARLGQTEANTNRAMGRAELALKNLENLRLEQHFVLGVQDGTNFSLDSATLTAEAQHAIDTFLHNLDAGADVVFLVAGHTDSTGSEDYNYTLGRKRAATVARYLIMHKGLDPLRVKTVSYGEEAPLAANTTRDGRFKNRRVEIQVYKEIVVSAPGRQRLKIERSSGGGA